MNKFKKVDILFIITRYDMCNDVLRVNTQFKLESDKSLIA
jgi:hypothetical protein